MVGELRVDLSEDVHVPSRLSVTPLVAHGLLDATRAGRIEAALQALLATSGEDWSITRLKQNPGAFMAEVISRAPQIMADNKRKNAERIVALSADDLMSLIEAAINAAGPGFATGRQMYDRLARSGPPLEITTQGLPRRRQQRLSIEDALAATPVAPEMSDEG